MDATRETVHSADQHREVVDVTTTDRPKVLDGRGEPDHCDYDRMGSGILGI